jgi:thiol peroxidase
MAKTAFKGTPVSTSGELPKVGAKAPEFTLTKNDLGAATLKDYAGKFLVLNVFPSVDTAVCATSVRRFNVEAAKLPNTAVLCVSKDLPFAQKRFCGAEGIDKVATASWFRGPDFGAAYGLTMTEGPLAGLFARAVVVVDPSGTVVHSQLVPEIAQEPDYAAALATVR